MLLARTFLALGGGCGFLVACSTLLGVEDVELRDEPQDGAAFEAGGGRDADQPPAVQKDGEVPAAAPAFVLSLGYYHSCALMSAGTLQCWGRNALGQLGDGAPVPLDGGLRPDVLKPQPVPGITDGIAIGSGIAHTCIVRKSGTVLCWGYNANGQVGTGMVRNEEPLPVAALNVRDAVAISAGASSTCALLEDKTVTCWGGNSSGQLGDGTKTGRPTPAPVNQLADVASISVGWGEHACAALSSGEVMCWGRNLEGQTGIGTLDECLTPKKVAGLSGIVQVASSHLSTCALQKGGRVYCWGGNDDGELGNELLSPGAHPTSALVPSIDDATSVLAGYAHFCALRKGGGVLCWGRARYGALGAGTLTTPDTPPRPTPGPVVGLTTAVSMWVGGTHSCVLEADKRVLCWGENVDGRFGNGTKGIAYAAIPINFP